LFALERSRAERSKDHNGRTQRFLFAQVNSRESYSVATLHKA